MNIQTVITPRLTLRRVRAEDWPELREIWIDEANGPMASYDKPSDTSEEAVKARVARWDAVSEGNEHMFFAVILGTSVIGYAALNARPGGYELGYCFHSAHHGKGYAKESLSALLAWLASTGESLRVTAGTALANTPSVRLLEALGFTMTGTEEVSFYTDEQGRPIVFTGGQFEKTLS